MVSGQFTFREYKAEDLTRCSELAEQAWPVRERLGRARDEPSMMKPWIESSQYSSTWSEVAVESGEVVGFLFGSIDNQKPKGAAVEVVTGQFWMFRRFLSRDVNRLDIPLSALLGFFFMEFKLAVNRPDADAEIILVIVDTRFRGKGVGKTLVDRFLKAAKDSGASAILLYTDDRTSNWRFYEHYGFRKVNTFYDNISSFFAGERANAIYYVLDLERK